MSEMEDRIVSHFKDEHLRLLQRASIDVNVSHPNEIRLSGTPGIHASGTNPEPMDFTLEFDISDAHIFYFGTLTADGRFMNEAVAGRRSTNDKPSVRAPSYEDPF